MPIFPRAVRLRAIWDGLQEQVLPLVPTDEAATQYKRRPQVSSHGAQLRGQILEIVSHLW